MANQESMIDAGSFRITNFFVPPELYEIKEERRRRVLVTFILIGITALFSFSFFHLTKNNTLLFTVDLLAGCTLTICLFCVKLIKQSNLIFRISSLVTAVLLLFFLGYGGVGGSALLWMYVYPFFVFLLLGILEGLIWIMIIYVLSITLIFFPPAFLTIYPYGIEFKVRFLSSFFIVGLFAYISEYFRRKHEQQAESLISSLQKALNEIKKLRGIIPVCSYCKQIRDDHGYWQQVDEYLTSYTDVDISHGICPNCLKNNFPDYNNE